MSKLSNRFLGFIPLALAIVVVAVLLSNAGVWQTIAQTYGTDPYGAEASVPSAPAEPPAPPLPPGVSDRVDSGLGVQSFLQSEGQFVTPEFRSVSFWGACVGNTCTRLGTVSGIVFSVPLNAGATSFLTEIINPNGWVIRFFLVGRSGNTAFIQVNVYNPAGVLVDDKTIIEVTNGAISDIRNR
jgi:hypothetical protein